MNISQKNVQEMSAYFRVRTGREDTHSTNVSTTFPRWASPEQAVRVQAVRCYPASRNKAFTPQAAFDLLALPKFPAFDLLPLPKFPAFDLLPFY